MITRGQYLSMSLTKTCEKSNINNEAYKTGFMNGAHIADTSLLETFETWIKYQAKYGKLLFHEKGFQNEDEMISSFKSWLGL